MAPHIVAGAFRLRQAEGFKIQPFSIDARSSAFPCTGGGQFVKDGDYPGSVDHLQVLEFIYQAEDISLRISAVT